MTELPNSEADAAEILRTAMHQAPSRRSKIVGMVFFPAAALVIFGIMFLAR